MFDNVWDPCWKSGCDELAEDDELKRNEGVKGCCCCGVTQGDFFCYVSCCSSGSGVFPAVTFQQQQQQQQRWCRCRIAVIFSSSRIFLCLLQAWYSKMNSYILKEIPCFAAMQHYTTLALGKVFFKNRRLLSRKHELFCGLHITWKSECVFCNAKVYWMGFVPAAAAVATVAGYYNNVSSLVNTRFVWI